MLGVNYNCEEGSGLFDEERRKLFSIRPTIITTKFM